MLIQSVDVITSECINYSKTGRQLFVINCTIRQLHN